MVPRQYPWLSEDKHVDVCIVGGGMTGAMCAMFAAEMGLGVVLITSGAVGYGDTGHITGCAGFDGGRTLNELDRLMTVDDALGLYQMGLEALDGLQNLCGRLDGEYRKTGISSGFTRRDLLLFTSDPTDIALMEREYIAVRNKFSQCSFVTRKTAESSFEFPVCGGILTAEGSAVFSPYALAHLCLMKAGELGAEIFEQTEAVDIQIPRTEDGSVFIRTSTRRNIYADRLIFAAGSEGTRILGGKVKKRSLFAVVAKLPETGAAWSGRCTLGTFGKRLENYSVSPGGLQQACRVCERGIPGRLFRSSSEDLIFNGLKAQLQKMIPEPDGMKIKYEYRYDFSSAPDGLPIIGKHDGFKNCVFALPGLWADAGAPVFSYIASKAATDLIQNSKHEIFSHFDPLRLI